MKPEIIKSIVRTVLAVVGGGLVAAGVVDEASYKVIGVNVEVVVGTGLALYAQIWSILHKQKVEKQIKPVE